MQPNGQRFNQSQFIKAQGIANKNFIRWDNQPLRHTPLTLDAERLIVLTSVRSASEATAANPAFCARQDHHTIARFGRRDIAPYADNFAANFMAGDARVDNQGVKPTVGI
ncbi:hypothetical protein D3C78_1486820 [compost metagenome]